MKISISCCNSSLFTFFGRCLNFVRPLMIVSPNFYRLYVNYVENNLGSYLFSITAFELMLSSSFHTLETLVRAMDSAIPRAGGWR